MGSKVVAKKEQTRVIQQEKINKRYFVEAFKMAEELDVEINFLPTNTSKLHLHMEQLLQNNYWMLAEDHRLPKT